MLFPCSVHVFFITTNFYLLQFYIVQFVKLIHLLGLQKLIYGPFFLPCKRRRFSVLRSIHIYKRSGLSYIFKVWRVGFIFHKFVLSDYKVLICFILFLKYKLPLGLNLKIVFKYSNVN